MEAVIIDALAFGFLGSSHCIGMCGPLALSLPINRGQYFSIALYHFGRILSYSALGAILGLLGLGVSLAGFQQPLSIALGSLMIIGTLWNLKSYAAALPKIANGFTGVVLSAFKKHLHSSLFVSGIINGLLPCGFVYYALVWTSALGGIKEGILFMLFFGIGTLPAMLSVNLFGMWASVSVRNRIKRLFPILVILMGILLVLRGLNLGIPYVSPLLPSSGENEAICH